MKLRDNKLNSLKDSFSELLTFSEKDKLELDALLLSSRFLSEASKVMDERKMKKKDLANTIGVSPSFLSQLFNGDKILNLLTVAKMQRALEINFFISKDAFGKKYEPIKKLNSIIGQSNESHNNKVRKLIRERKESKEDSPLSICYNHTRSIGA